MPKSKPDSVVVHRIELQQSERDIMETALIGNFVTSGIGAVGNLLKPFEGAITALAAAWIAKDGIEEVFNWARGVGEEQKQEIIESYEVEGAPYLNDVSSWLNSAYADGGWERVCINPLGWAALKRTRDMYYVGEFDKRMPQWFVREIAQFLLTVCDTYGTATIPGGANPNVLASGKTPMQLWSEYMTIERYGSMAYYYEQLGDLEEGPLFTRWLYQNVFGWARRDPNMP